MKSKKERESDYAKYMEEQRNNASHALAEKEQPGIIYDGLTGVMSVRSGNNFIPWTEDPKKVVARQKYLTELRYYISKRMRDESISR